MLFCGRVKASKGGRPSAAASFNGLRIFSSGGDRCGLTWVWFDTAVVDNFACLRIKTLGHNRNGAVGHYESAGKYHQTLSAGGDVAGVAVARNRALVFRRIDSMPRRAARLIFGVVVRFYTRMMMYSYTGCHRLVDGHLSVFIGGEHVYVLARGANSVNGSEWVLPSVGRDEANRWFGFPFGARWLPAG
ncbi:hypothetical protein KCP77_15920 [Salmonella enterica subsp. enterica]|nr:hypothetical protein KCP77_15920 [Salmonella enterica subsp. enterica]